MRKATLTSTINGESVEVYATTEHSASSYGMPVWVDDDGQAYCQVGFEAPFYTIIEKGESPSIADRLKKARESKGITLRCLSELTGINASNLSRIERGEVSPTFDTLTRICEALGLTITID